MMYHKDDACFAQEINKDKRPAWYMKKMVRDAAAGEKNKGT